jgi:inhibitor of cysteine peptidase
MLAIDHTQNNGNAEVHVGDSFQVQLAENPTTGYRWHIKSFGDPALRIIDDSFAASQGGYGGGGMRHWTFEADHPAVVPLCFELKRSWQPQSVEIFNVTVNVKAR